VAVVSISKIQVRRGQKNTGSGLPQLASGELGWAIDTRELYIGNGSVSEGAPAVGNTKILTQYDDIFTIARTYTYKSNEGYLVTGTDSSSPIQRSLQDRLDDRVSIRSFGANGDGTIDDTAAIQRALDQLYLNAATKADPDSRVVLHIEPGVYRLTSTVFIPPYATIKGAGSDKTIFRVEGNVAAFQTVNSFSEPGNHENFADGDPYPDSSSFDNQARNIHLEGISIEHTGSAQGIILQNCRDSLFRDVKITGIWQPSDAFDASQAAFELNSLSNAVETENNRFENCEVVSYCVAVKSDWDIHDNLWSACRFENHYHGFLFGDGIVTLGSPGQLTGPYNNTIENCQFLNINRQAILVEEGVKNISRSNSFKGVGNNQGTEVQPVYSVVKFSNPTNKSFEDYFERTQHLISGSALNTVPYISEIEGTAFYELEYEHNQSFGRLQNVRLFRLPGVQNQSYELDYIMVGETYEWSRAGVLSITVDAYNDSVSVSDNYDFIGDESYLDDISFDARLRSLGAGATEFNTIDVRVNSTMPVDDQTNIKFTIKAKKSDII